MSTVVDKEIEAYKGDLEASKKRLDGARDSYGLAMLNGLGEQIKEDLKHPLKPKRTFKQKIRKWLRRY